MTEHGLIQAAKQAVLGGGNLDRDSIISLLEIDPYSAMAEKLGEAAREVAAQITGNQAGIWSAIGVDYQICSMNCDFCSLGEAWGIVQEGHEWNLDNVISAAHHFVSEGARWVTLRTTQFYGIDRLIEIVKKIRTCVSGDYKIVVNTGEFDVANANRLYNAGVQIVYHSLRLKEGIHTRFTCKERCDTLKAIQNSPLELAYLVEPIGAEHSNAEIADVFLTAMKYGAVLSGAMGRVPVPGTPLGALPPVSERRMAQIVAVTRLAGGRQCPDICIHPSSQLALEWGANVVVVETGAVPRSHEKFSDEWQGFTMDTAKTWLQKAGYRIV